MSRKPSRMSKVDRDTGGFKTSFAYQKTWKINHRLARSIRATIPVTTDGRPTTVLDIGAGVGMYVTMMRLAGYEATGIDAIQGIGNATNQLVREFNAGMPLDGHEIAPDWSVCFEVGEHVPKNNEGNLLDRIANARQGVMMSWATGYRGTGHVNPRSQRYIIKKMRWRGWEVDAQATTVAKATSGYRHLLVFERKKRAVGQM